MEDLAMSEPQGLEFEVTVTTAVTRSELGAPLQARGFATGDRADVSIHVHQDTGFAQNYEEEDDEDSQDPSVTNFAVVATRVTSVVRTHLTQDGTSASQVGRGLTTVEAHQLLKAPGYDLATTQVSSTSSTRILQSTLREAASDTSTEFSCSLSTTILVARHGHEGERNSSPEPITVEEVLEEELGTSEVAKSNTRAAPSDDKKKYVIFLPRPRNWDRQETNEIVADETAQAGLLEDDIHFPSTSASDSQIGGERKVIPLEPLLGVSRTSTAASGQSASITRSSGLRADRRGTSHAALRRTASQIPVDTMKQSKQLVQHELAGSADGVSSRSGTGITVASTTRGQLLAPATALTQSELTVTYSQYQATKGNSGVQSSMHVRALHLQPITSSSTSDELLQLGGEEPRLDSLSRTRVDGGSNNQSSNSQAVSIQGLQLQGPRNAKDKFPSGRAPSQASPNQPVRIDNATDCTMASTFCGIHVHGEDSKTQTTVIEMQTGCDAQSMSEERDKLVPVPYPQVDDAFGHRSQRTPVPMPILEADSNDGRQRVSVPGLTITHNGVLKIVSVKGQDAKLRSSPLAAVEESKDLKGGQLLASIQESSMIAAPEPSQAAIDMQSTVDSGGKNFSNERTTNESRDEGLHRHRNMDKTMSVEDLIPERAIEQHILTDDTQFGKKTVAEAVVSTEISTQSDGVLDAVLTEHFVLVAMQPPQTVGQNVESAPFPDSASSMSCELQEEGTSGVHSVDINPSSTKKDGNTFLNAHRVSNLPRETGKLFLADSETTSSVYTAISTLDGPITNCAIHKPDEDGPETNCAIHKPDEVTTVPSSTPPFSPLLDKKLNPTPQLSSTHTGNVLSDNGTSGSAKESEQKAPTKHDKSEQEEATVASTALHIESDTELKASIPVHGGMAISKFQSSKTFEGDTSSNTWSASSAPAGSSNTEMHLQEVNEHGLHPATQPRKRVGPSVDMESKESQICVLEHEGRGESSTSGCRQEVPPAEAQVCQVPGPCPFCLGHSLLTTGKAKLDILKIPERRSAGSTANQDRSAFTQDTEAGSSREELDKSQQGSGPDSPQLAASPVPVTTAGLLGGNRHGNSSGEPGTSMIASLTTEDRQPDSATQEGDITTNDDHIKEGAGKSSEPTKLQDQPLRGHETQALKQEGHIFSSEDTPVEKELNTQKSNTQVLKVESNPFFFNQQDHRRTNTDLVHEITLQSHLSPTPLELEKPTVNPTAQSDLIATSEHTSLTDGHAITTTIKDTCMHDNLQGPVFLKKTSSLGSKHGSTTTTVLTSLPPEAAFDSPPIETTITSQNDCPQEVPSGSMEPKLFATTVTNEDISTDLLEEKEGHLSSCKNIATSHQSEVDRDVTTDRTCCYPTTRTELQSSTSPQPQKTSSTAQVQGHDTTDKKAIVDIFPLLQPEEPQHRRGDSDETAEVIHLKEGAETVQIAEHQDTDSADKTCCYPAAYKKDRRLTATTNTQEPHIESPSSEKDTSAATAAEQTIQQKTSDTGDSIPPYPGEARSLKHRDSGGKMCCYPLVRRESIEDTCMHDNQIGVEQSDHQSDRTTALKDGSKESEKPDAESTPLDTTTSTSIPIVDHSENLVDEQKSPQQSFHVPKLSACCLPVTTTPGEDHTKDTSAMCAIGATEPSIKESKNQNTNSAGKTCCYPAANKKEGAPTTNMQEPVIESPTPQKDTSAATTVQKTIQHKISDASDRLPSYPGKARALEHQDSGKICCYPLTRRESKSTIEDTCMHDNQISVNQSDHQSAHATALKDGSKESEKTDAETTPMNTRTSTSIPMVDHSENLVDEQKIPQASFHVPRLSTCCFPVTTTLGENHPRDSPGTSATVATEPSIKENQNQDTDSADKTRCYPAAYQKKGRLIAITSMQEALIESASPAKDAIATTTAEQTIQQKTSNASDSLPPSPGDARDLKHQDSGGKICCYPLAQRESKSTIEDTCMHDNQMGVNQPNQRSAYTIALKDGSTTSGKPDAESTTPLDTITSTSIPLVDHSEKLVDEQKSPQGSLHVPQQSTCCFPVTTTLGEDHPNESPGTFAIVATEPSIKESKKQNTDSADRSCCYPAAYKREQRLRSTTTMQEPLIESPTPEKDTSAATTDKETIQHKTPDANDSLLPNSGEAGEPKRRDSGGEICCYPFAGRESKSAIEDTRMQDNQTGINQSDNQSTRGTALDEGSQESAKPDAESKTPLEIIPSSSIPILDHSNLVDEQMSRRRSFRVPKMSTCCFPATATLGDDHPKDSPGTSATVETEPSIKENEVMIARSSLATTHVVNEDGTESTVTSHMFLVAVDDPNSAPQSMKIIPEVTSASDEPTLQTFRFKGDNDDIITGTEVTVSSSPEINAETRSEQVTVEDPAKKQVTSRMSAITSRCMPEKGETCQNIRKHLKRIKSKLLSCKPKVGGATGPQPLLVGTPAQELAVPVPQETKDESMSLEEREAAARAAALREQELAESIERIKEATLCRKRLLDRQKEEREMQPDLDPYLQSRLCSDRTMQRQKAIAAHDERERQRQFAQARRGVASSREWEESHRMSTAFFDAKSAAARMRRRQIFLESEQDVHAFAGLAEARDNFVATKRRNMTRAATDRSIASEEVKMMATRQQDNNMHEAILWDAKRRRHRIAWEARHAGLRIMDRDRQLATKEEEETQLSLLDTLEILDARTEQENQALETWYDNYKCGPEMPGGDGPEFNIDYFADTASEDEDEEVQEIGTGQQISEPKTVQPLIQPVPTNNAAQPTVAQISSCCGER